MTYVPAVLKERLEKARGTYIARFDESRRKLDCLSAFRPLLAEKERQWLEESRARMLVSPDNKELNQLAGNAHVLVGQLVVQLHKSGLTYKEIGEIVSLSVERIRQYALRYDRLWRAAQVNSALLKYFPWK